MYAQFDLPTYSQFSNAWEAIHSGIILSVDSWSKEHGISYTTKVAKDKLRVCFPNYEDYTFFALSWNPQSDDNLNQSG